MSSPSSPLLLSLCVTRTWHCLPSDVLSESFEKPRCDLGLVFSLHSKGLLLAQDGLCILGFQHLLPPAP